MAANDEIISKACSLRLALFNETMKRPAYANCIVAIFFFKKISRIFDFVRYK